MQVQRPSLSWKIASLSTDHHVCLELLKFDRIIRTRCHFDVQGGGSKSILSKVHLCFEGSFSCIKQGQATLLFNGIQGYVLWALFIKITKFIVQDQILGSSPDYVCELFYFLHPSPSQLDLIVQSCMV